MVNKMKHKVKKFTSVFLLIMVLSLLVFGCGSENLNATKAQKLIDYQTDQYKDMEATGELINNVRVIHVKAWQFEFEPKLIVVNKGEKVRLVISAEDVPHGFEIEGFQMPNYDINTKIRPGIPLELEFTANEQGIWEFICTVYCGFGHSTMKGTFVIR